MSDRDTEIVIVVCKRGEPRQMATTLTFKNLTALDEWRDSDPDYRVMLIKKGF